MYDIIRKDDYNGTPIRKMNQKTSDSPTRSPNQLWLSSDDIEKVRALKLGKEMYLCTELLSELKLSIFKAPNDTLWLIIGDGAGSVLVNEPIEHLRYTLGE